MATTWPGAGMGSSSSSSKKKSKKTKKSQSAAKRYEQKVESGRERGIRQSQTGSKYDKDVAKVAREHGLALQHKAPPGREDPTGAVQEYNRQQRIASGTATDEDKRQIQNIANITGKNPYGAQTVGGITTLEKERELGTTTTDGKTDDKKETVKYYDDELGGISERDLKSWEMKLGQTAKIINGKVFFIDKTTNKFVPYGKMIRALSGTLDNVFGFKPEKAFGTTNPRVAASFADMFEKMSPERWEEFISGKGNLDRILEYTKTLNPNEERQMMDLITSGDTKGLAEQFKQSGMILGEDAFLDEYNKRANPNQYYQDNPPRTQDEMEEMLRSGITMTKANTQMIQDARNRVSESRQQQFGGDGGGGGGADPTDPTDPTKVPDYVLKQQYMPNFTPSYTGGPEQMQIAGGYWDPITKKWIGQGPWGTQNQYQFPPNPVVQLNQGGIVGTSPLLFKNQGGMVNDGGIKAFKKYGY